MDRGDLAAGSQPGRQPGCTRILGRLSRWSDETCASGGFSSPIVRVWCVSASSLRSTSPSVVVRLRAGFHPVGGVEQPGISVSGGDLPQMVGLLQTMVADASGIGSLRRQGLAMAHAARRAVEPVGRTTQSCAVLRQSVSGTTRALCGARQSGVSGAACRSGERPVKPVTMSLGQYIASDEQQAERNRHPPALAQRHTELLL